MKLLLATLALPLMLLACTPAIQSSTDTPSTGAQSVTKTLYVGPERVPCTGVTPQECLQVKETPEADWTLLYSGIDGFEYEAGHFYVLRVSEEQLENPPADASSIRLNLLEVLDRTPVGDLAETLQGSRWTLQTFGPADASQGVVDGTEVTFQFFDTGRVAGSAGCNRYMANIAFDGARVQIEAPASTLMFCGEEGVMEQEQVYLQTLATVERLEARPNRPKGMGTATAPVLKVPWASAGLLNMPSSSGIVTPAMPRSRADWASTGPKPRTKPTTSQRLRRFQRRGAARSPARVPARVQRGEPETVMNRGLGKVVIACAPQLGVPSLLFGGPDPGELGTDLEYSTGAAPRFCAALGREV